MIEITVSQEVIRSAREFANSVVSTNSYYSNRGQSNRETIIEQVFTGKLGEYAVRHWYLGKGCECSEVDVTITRNKTFNPDLIVDGCACHVKSQNIESANRFGTSWTFQYAGSSGSGHRDREIFDTYGDRDRVVFCVVRAPIVMIMAELKIVDLHRLDLFGFPKKKELADFKRVVYLDKIPNEFMV